MRHFVVWDEERPMLTPTFEVFSKEYYFENYPWTVDPNKWIIIEQFEAVNPATGETVMVDGSVDDLDVWCAMYEIDQTVGDVNSWVEQINVKINEPEPPPEPTEEELRLQTLEAENQQMQIALLYMTRGAN